MQAHPPHEWKQKYETLMHSAARWGHVEVLNLLFAHRSRGVNLRDDVRASV